jgi:hypothetical protein
MCHYDVICHCAVKLFFNWNTVFMQISDCAFEGCTLIFEGKSREMHHLCYGYTNKKKPFDVQALTIWRLSSTLVVVPYH